MAIIILVVISMAIIIIQDNNVLLSFRIPDPIQINRNLLKSSHGGIPNKKVENI